MSKTRRLTKNTKNSRKQLSKIKVLNTVAQNGKIFGVKFIKKDGSERLMSCRLGVTKHLKGGVNTTSHIPKYKTVYSVNDKGYRNINLETIKQVKGCGKVYNF